MSKTAREVFKEQIVGPTPGWTIDDAEADAIFNDLDAAGFVIVPKEAGDKELQALASNGRRDFLAKMIFDWFNRPAAGDHNAEPSTYNEFADRLEIGVDGELDCKSIAAAVDNALAEREKPMASPKT